VGPPLFLMIGMWARLLGMQVGVPSTTRYDLASLIRITGARAARPRPDLTSAVLGPTRPGSVGRLESGSVPSATMSATAQDRAAGVAVAARFFLFSVRVVVDKTRVG
jgi:hypothetical protein